MFEKFDVEGEAIIIDALRGLAALLVLVSHADAYYLIRIAPIVPYSGYLGAIGVCIFFILSGYLIWRSAGRTLAQANGLRTYALHRAARIMPLYYVALAFAFVVFPHISDHRADVTTYTVIRHVTFTQALLPDVSTAVNPVLWTLTYEMLFYLVVPFLYALRRYFSFLLIVSIFTFVLGHIFPSPYFKFFNLLPLFVLGMWLAEYRIALTWRFALVSMGAAIILGLIGSRAYLISALWAVAVLSAAISLRGYRASLIFKVFAWVGVCSYSLYIWHYMMIESIGPGLMRFDHFPERYPLITAVCFTTLAIGAAWASYKLIERPAQIWIRKSFSRPSGGNRQEAAEQPQN
ncbi:acyltransferase [Neorhizobium sp. P12A]|uniref:acyltransferase family protein n=1 Tax=Neorhizobium sp. P12A TaxID=2268027 RepID=UPI0011F05570|nr:acyltransferase [Neorhizobium sp. P12A]KAA0685991.1 acyltransferase [Neorhizobium sp. P12A]